MQKIKSLDIIAKFSKKIFKIFKKNFIYLGLKKN